jgi:hypothetical protein
MEYQLLIEIGHIKQQAFINGNSVSKHLADEQL